MAFSEKGLNVRLLQVNVMRRNFDEKRLLLLCLEDASNVRAAQRAQRFTRHHPLFIRWDDQDGYFRVVPRDAAHLVKSARLAVAFGIERNAHAIKSLQC